MRTMNHHSYSPRFYDCCFSEAVDFSLDTIVMGHRGYRFDRDSKFSEFVVTSRCRGSDNIERRDTSRWRTNSTKASVALTCQALLQNSGDPNLRNTREYGIKDIMRSSLLSPLSLRLRKRRRASVQQYWLPFCELPLIDFHPFVSARSHLDKEISSDCVVEYKKRERLNQKPATTNSDHIKVSFPWRELWIDSPLPRAPGNAKDFVLFGTQSLEPPPSTCIDNRDEISLQKTFLGIGCRTNMREIEANRYILT